MKEHKKVVYSVKESSVVLTLFFLYHCIQRGEQQRIEEGPIYDAFFGYLGIYSFLSGADLARA